MMIGIYQITNLRSGKIYIGQSLDVLARIRQHKYELKHNLHLNRYLQSAWNKYGESNFVFSVLEEVSEDELTEREKYWVDFYGGYESDKLYNLREPGPSGRLSEETRKKLSVSAKQWRRDNPDKVNELSRSLKASWTPERRAEFSKLKSGRKLSDETKQKLKKYSDARIGVSRPDEVKQKISDTLKGHPVSEETRQKLREAAKRQPRRKLTDEEKKRRSEQAKAQWARRKVNATEVLPNGQVCTRN